MNKKPSFLERLTGSASLRNFEEDFEEDFETEEALEDTPSEEGTGWPEAPQEPQEEGELPVDMYQTSDSIVIRALVAGVHPNDLDIAITRDMVTVRGMREEDQEAPNEDYYHRELYWGGFSRKILLPEEVQIDEAEAREKHGLLEIVLPKVDKERSAKLKVKIQNTK